MEASVIELNLPASLQYLNVLSACLGEILAQLDEVPDRAQATYNLQLAVHEIGANIVEHAYAGAAGRIAVTLTLSVTPRRLIVELRDDATRTFNPVKLQEPALDDLQTRGRGVWLTRQLTDELVYQSRDNQCWRAEQGGTWQPCLGASPGTGQNYWRLSKSL